MEYAPPSVLLGIPSGIEGTRQTLFIMRAAVQQGMVNPLIRQFATQLTISLPQKDWRGEINALFRFVRDNIRYVRDIHTVETIQTAERTLLNRSGDCDDKSVLLASLLKAIGHPARFVAVGLKSPHRCDHVYVETPTGPSADAGWMALETTEPVAAGWSAMNTGRVRKTLIMEI